MKMLGLISKKIHFLIIYGVTTSCATMVRPPKDWTQPVNLNLKEDSLAGVSIELLCAKGSFDEEKFSYQASSACSSLKGVLAGIGAQVSSPQVAEDPEDSLENEDAEKKIPAKPHPPQFTVTYIDRGGERDWCGWTSLALIFSGGLFPCIEDIHSEAEIRFFDVNGLNPKQERFAFDQRVIFGWVGIYYLVAKAVRRDGRRRTQFAYHFLQTIQNSVYSYSVARGLVDPVNVAEF